MANKKLLGFQIFLFFAMIMCFSWQIYDNFQKFIAQKSSISHTEILKEHPETLPSFSICAEPPFDEDYLKNQLNVSSNLFYFTNTFATFKENNNFPIINNSNTEQTLMYFWNQSVLGPLMIGVQDDFIYRHQSINESTWQEIQSIDILNSLWYGQCISVVLKKPRKAHERLIVSLGFHSDIGFTESIPYDLLMIIHETPGSRFSLIPGDYISSGTFKQENQFSEVFLVNK